MKYLSKIYYHIFFNSTGQGKDISREVAQAWFRLHITTTIYHGIFLYHRKNIGRQNTLSERPLGKERI
jgi:hypothetical protein